MATIRYFLYSKTKGKLAPIYVRLSAGRGNDIIAKTGETIYPELWSYKKQSINLKVLGKKEQEQKNNLIELAKVIDKEVNNSFDELSKDWLEEVVYRFNNKKSSDAETFMEFVERFIEEADAGIRKNDDLMKLAPGTIANFKAFKRLLTDYQVKRSEELKRNIIVDFDNINIDFYKDFVNYLSDEGFSQNTIGKNIKLLKTLMNKALEEKLHSNRDFQFRSFKGISRKSFNVYLTKAELDTIYNKDLSDRPGLDRSRDAFIVLCETGLRVSDYSKVSVNIHTAEDGVKFIHLSQEKTKGEVIIPVSARLQEILDKYHGTLPKVLDQTINIDIKKVAQLCGINEELRWTENRLGKSYEKACQKWGKISCHTGRRTFCTNAFLAGIPTISIMMISGHTSEASFLRYIKMTKEENARKLAEHEYFRGNLKVV
jgi:integrase